LTDAPDRDVIEVSIFGPGKGESILVHLGKDEWVIVDSCINRRTNNIPALEYLDRIGVDASSQVRLVVATHAHDDHFAGISKVLERCTSADFVCQTAMVKEQFLELVEMDRRLAPEVRASALSEYRRAFEIVRERTPRGGVPPLKLAIQERMLLDDGDGAKVLALSPSDQAHVRSLQVLAGALSAAQSARKIRRIDPNELAIALWVEAGGKAILLGADLLKGPTGCGWDAVLGFFRPPTKASVYKVAHHGSSNAHHDGIWEQLLADGPIALLAPYRAGRSPVPSTDDCKRICSLTSKAFITAKPDLPAPSREVKKAIATVGPLGQNVREVWGEPGHVRARSGPNQVDWDVVLVPPARPLCPA
jgi:beta-lactamase superfamily II metal-dependent hydrolase